MAKERVFIALACHKCQSHQFLERKSLHRHYTNVEEISLPPPPKGNPHYSTRFDYEITKVKENASTIMYTCPCCNDLLKDMNQLTEHINTIHIINKQTEEESNADATDESVEDDDAALDTDLDDDDDFTPEEFDSERNQTLPVIKPTLKLDMPNPDKSVKKLRAYDEAIIHACQQEGDENDKNKTKYIVDTLSLRPFTVLDNYGDEENALAHSTIINRLVKKHDHIKSIPTMKRPYENDNINSSVCVKCSSPVCTDLNDLFAMSPYSSLLKQREYVPLTEDMCKLLNKDWEFYPQVKYFSARLLAGSIVINNNNKQAIMINSVEMYGRTKHTDRHREPFGKVKNDIIATSLPPPIKMFHKDVWPTSINGRDGKKLVIGTQVSNALITSSTRLDQKGVVSIGATSTHFKLDTIKDSLATKIFIDIDSLKYAKELVEDPSTRSVSDVGMLVHQLRQVRTKFHLPTTYSLCRASGPITSNHTCHPYSLFTLSECDRARNPSASIFRVIANEVLSNTIDPKLPKQLVTQCFNESKGKNKKIFSKILALYQGDEVMLPILLNDPLNKKLETLATLLVPSIVDANKSVEVYVKEVFEVSDHL